MSRFGNGCSRTTDPRCRAVWVYRPDGHAFVHTYTCGMNSRQPPVLRAHARPGARWIVGTGLLVAVLAMGIIVAHAKVMTPSDGVTSATELSTAVTPADYGAQVLAPSPADGHADAGCAMCGNHTEGAMVACLTIVIAVAGMTVRRDAPTSWQQRLPRAPSDESRPPHRRVPTPSLTVLCVSRT